MLGCIPKTPSPAPESIAVTDRGQEMKALRVSDTLILNDQCSRNV